MIKTTIAALLALAAAGYVTKDYAQAGAGVGANVGIGAGANTNSSGAKTGAGVGVSAGAKVDSGVSGNVTSDEDRAKAEAQARAQARARSNEAATYGRPIADPTERRTVYGDGRARSGMQGSASTGVGGSGNLQR